MTPEGVADGVALRIPDGRKLGKADCPLAGDCVGPTDGCKIVGTSVGSPDKIVAGWRVGNIIGDAVRSSGRVGERDGDKDGDGEGDLLGFDEWPAGV